MIVPRRAKLPLSRGVISGLVQSFGFMGYALGVRPDNHTNPKRKRGFRLLAIALRARMTGLSPAIEPRLVSGLVRLYGCLGFTLAFGPSDYTNPKRKF